VTVVDVVSEVESVGAAFRLDGEKVRIWYPSEESRKELAAQIKLLRNQRAEVAAYIRARNAIPAMPAGVRLVRWEPKTAPIILTRCSVVTDVRRFISITLLELKSAIVGQRWQSGNWSVRELVDRLEQCGVLVQITESGRER
jgi:hypothetical protein